MPPAELPRWGPSTEEWPSRFHGSPLAVAVAMGRSAAWGAKVGGGALRSRGFPRKDFRVRNGESDGGIEAMEDLFYRRGGGVPGGGRNGVPGVGGAMGGGGVRGDQEGGGRALGVKPGPMGGGGGVGEG